MTETEMMFAVRALAILNAVEGNSEDKESFVLSIGEGRQLAGLVERWRDLLIHFAAPGDEAEAAGASAYAGELLDLMTAAEDDAEESEQ
jgi:hypothetical protein